MDGVEEPNSFPNKSCVALKCDRTHAAKCDTPSINIGLCGNDVPTTQSTYSSEATPCVKTTTQSTHSAVVTSDVKTTTQSIHSDVVTSDVKTTTQSTNSTEVTSDVRTTTQSTHLAEVTSDVKTMTQSTRSAVVTSDLKTTTQSTHSAEVTSDVKTTTQSTHSAEVNSDVRTTTQSTPTAGAIAVVPTMSTNVVPTAYNNTLVDGICEECCVKNNKSNQLSHEELKSVIKELKSQLAVNKNNLSTNRRKLISVYDSRPSSVAMGGVAIAIMIVIPGIIVIPDMVNLGRFFYRRQNKLLI
ncbi:mucin-3A-like [Mizuhopecten yessoensis]|uniref:mucin-3A-like n=1 Tax=Mizuhopecten yessoensis TaxID=6573 RepID=UPI000B45D691|nr:mucin-3A-like [Mizuhopecten yessoensis]